MPWWGWLIAGVVIPGLGLPAIWAAWRSYKNRKTSSNLVEQARELAKQHVEMAERKGAIRDAEVTKEAESVANSVPLDEFLRDRSKRKGRAI